jgi:predicted GNAT superfamily acetyltransferase
VPITRGDCLARACELNRTVRDAERADFDILLRLNLESEAALSPLPLARLEALHDQAWYHRVVCLDGTVRAFLLALRAGVDYDSPNYRWFAARFADFVYIDRIVVSSTARHAGLATLLYEDLLRRAGDNGVERVTCEFDTDPPNEASRRFHERFGFVEIGAQRVAGGKKGVSLQALRLPLLGGH